MVWTQTSPGVWTDEYDGAEKVFYRMSQAFKDQGGEHGSVNLFCQIKTEDVEPSTLERYIREAWKQLRFVFPSLAVCEHGGAKTYFKPTIEDVEKWATDTFLVGDAPTARDVIPNLHLRKLPCLVYIAQSSEILFHSSHWRIDALGACMVVDRLLENVAELIAAKGSLDPAPWELEFNNLSPSLEDAYGSLTVSTPATRAVAEEICRRNFDAAYPSVGLPFRGGPATTPGFSRFESVEFTAEASASLIAACKASGISVTAAVHAACAKMVFEHATDTDCEKYSTVVSANLRKLLPITPQQDIQGRGQPPFLERGSNYACGTYVTGIMQTLRHADDFMAWARQLTLGYWGSWDAAAYMGALRDIYRAHGKKLVEVARAGARTPASNVTVSSLGVVDGQYLRSHHVGIEVSKFHLGSSIMTRQPTLYIWTFRSCLTLSVDYNEAYYSLDQIRSLLEGIQLYIGKELKVELHGSRSI